MAVWPMLFSVGVIQLQAIQTAECDTANQTGGLRSVGAPRSEPLQEAPTPASETRGVRPPAPDATPVASAVAVQAPPAPPASAAPAAAAKTQNGCLPTRWSGNAHDYNLTKLVLLEFPTPRTTAALDPSPSKKGLCTERAYRRPVLGDTIRQVLSYTSNITLQSQRPPAVCALYSQNALHTLAISCMESSWRNIDYEAPQ